MPTKLYAKQDTGSLSFGGKEYVITDGAVDVPDEAVATLTESHGFSLTAPEGVKVTKVADKEEEEDEDEKDFDLGTLSKAQLIAFNSEKELGAELKTSMTKDEIFGLVKPLWEEKQAA